MPEISPITFALPYRLGSVNGYLVKVDARYVLIDTGSSNQRAVLEKELCNAGCQPGQLKLIVLTYGDLDGDLLENTQQPALNSIMDDRGAAQASVEKLRDLAVKTVYPGHGEPFLMEQLAKNHR